MSQDRLPARPRRTNVRRTGSERRRLGARVLLVPGVGATIAGMVLEHGELMVTGLVLTGVAGHLATPRRGAPRRR